MRVLTDYHHGGLLYSLHLLFEKRLGWELFRPIGYDWFFKGFWKIAEPYGNAQDTIDQYLAIANRPYVPYVFLNGDPKLESGVYKIQDPENNFEHKAITMDQFKQMQFDLVVATFPTHDNWDLLLQYQPKAKFIMQLGNEGQTAGAKNVLSSVVGYRPRDDQNVLFYHQEIDTNNYYYGEPDLNSNKITSFVIGLPERETFEIYKSALPEFDFKAYGPGAIDGNLAKREDMGNTMRATKFGWHIKHADGFGHLLHSWFACGRPVIIRGSFYEGKTAGLLLQDQVTCIDIDKHPFEENLRLIRYWNQPENYKTMSDNVIRKYREIVDYDKEAEKLKDWLSKII